MTPPAVSVIMNCYNSAAHLRSALQSLLGQTCDDFELIFFDNASTDESPVIFRESAGIFSGRARYFRGERTVPLGAARNCALSHIRGGYVAFLDCDDLWLPEKLERQMSLFEANPKVGLVCTDTEIFDGDRVVRRLFSGIRPARGRVFAELVERQWISMSSAMLRREALESLPDEPSGETGGKTRGYFDERLNMCEEADVFYRIAHDWELDYVDAPLTRWRVHGANTTFRGFGQFADETLYILEKHRRLYPEYDTEHADLVDLLTRRAAFQKGVALWREGRGGQARAEIAPWRHISLKYRLFWWGSFLPGRCFDCAARIYFSLPAALRR
ncbi:MAG: glycosyltransferase [Desulfovibrio sp.]|jgi:glycosyltransferase involved in cell wall biosynthesis|nr:glycosyltransferase [Desulfovibrio sp.]